MNIDFVLCSQLLVNSLDISRLAIIIFEGKKKTIIFWEEVYCYLESMRFEFGET